MRRRGRKPDHWRKVVWYGWVTGAGLILLNATLAWLLGFSGLPNLIGV